MDNVEQRARELLEAECGRPLPLDVPVCAAHSAVVAALSQQPEATVFRNDGSSEADFIAHEANACTSCGGSGHRDDQKPEARGVVGELVEVGDDESGQPRLLIHTTRDAIRASNLVPFSQVEVRNG